jgi:hypothetical protein
VANFSHIEDADVAAAVERFVLLREPTPRGTP